MKIDENTTVRDAYNSVVSEIERLQGIENINPAHDWIGELKQARIKSLSDIALALSQII